MGIWTRADNLQRGRSNHPARAQRWRAAGWMGERRLKRIERVARTPSTRAQQPSSSSSRDLLHPHVSTSENVGS